MQLDVMLHKIIDDYNVLKWPTQQINLFLQNHKTVCKVALIINHLFRAIAMAALCSALPYSVPVNIALCFGGSLFYRLTVETNCAYKFALPAFFGSLTLPSALSALASLISGLAFISLATFMTTCFILLPFAAYATYVLLTVNYDVNDR